MRSKQFLTLLLALILPACPVNNLASSQTNSAAGLIPPTDNGPKILKTIKLDHGFKIETGKGISNGYITIYKLLILSHENKQVYIDSLQNRYEFDNPLYPIVLPIDSGMFQVLVNVNAEPEKGFLKCLTLRGDKVQDIKKIPLFIAPAANLDADNYLEVAGSWAYSIVEGDSGQFTVYDPILYYEITSKGLVLDRKLTIERNKMIYGYFYGYDFLSKVEIKKNGDCNGRIDAEYERIKKISKSDRSKNK